MTIAFECRWSALLSLKKQPVLHGSLVSLSVLLQLIPVLLLLQPQCKPQVECAGRWASEKNELCEFIADFTLISVGTICLKRIVPVLCKQKAAYRNYSESQSNSGRKAPPRVYPLAQSRASLGEVAQEQDFVFLFEFHEVSVGPFLQPVEGGPREEQPCPLYQPCPQPGIVCRLAEDMFCLQVVNGGIKQY